jgi:hypothetical protein
MKKRLLNFALVISILIPSLVPSVGRADFWGGDVAVLIQILAENIKQLVELENILQNGQNNLALIREINRGINDSLALIRTVSPYVNPGQYSQLKNVQDVLQKFGIIFGTVVNSPDAPAQRSVDTAVAEAITMNNAIFDYTKQTDEIGEQIKSFSHSVSPGGAAKLTAESLGVMLHVMNQQLRAQGVLLNLQAQGLAQSNKREKDSSAQFLRSAGDISEALKSSNPSFESPRF